VGSAALQPWNEDGLLGARNRRGSEGNRHGRRRTDGRRRHVLDRRRGDVCRGDLVLLDIWGKKNEPTAVYYDITWMGTVGAPSPSQQEIFAVVKKARDSAFQKVKSAVESTTRITGCEVDQVCRSIVADAGYEDRFVHRTGHSIGTEVHANGPHIDDFETRDDRELIPNICFSLEPGIYTADFGIRSEFDVLVRQNAAEITGAVQNEIVIM